MAGNNPTVVKQIIVQEQFRPYVGQVDEQSPVKYVDWLYMSILQLCLPCPAVKQKHRFQIVKQ